MNKNLLCNKLYKQLQKLKKDINLKDQDSLFQIKTVPIHIKFGIELLHYKIKKNKKLKKKQIDKI